MFRYLLLGLLIYIVIKAIRRLIIFRAYFKKARTAHGTGGSSGTANGTPAYGEMVKCAKCGTYIDRSQAVFSNNEWICGEKCS